MAICQRKNRNNYCSKNWRLSDPGYRLFYFQLNDLLSNQANSQDETHILFALENIITDVTAMFSLNQPSFLQMKDGFWFLWSIKSNN